MKVKDVINILSAELILGNNRLEDDVNSIGATDMMSDILALSEPGMLILTGNTSPQSVRSAIVTDLLGLVFVRGKNIPPETIRMAKESDLIIMKTDMFMYSACGRLYTEGLRGIDERE